MNKELREILENYITGLFIPEDKEKDLETELGAYFEFKFKQ